MKQITLFSFKRLLLLLIVTCIGTYGYGQEERVYFHDLSSSSNHYSIKVQDVIPNSYVNELDWGFLDALKMSSTSTNKYYLRFQGMLSDTENKYFAIKQTLEEGTYKVKMRIRDRYDEGNKFRFFYTTSNPATADFTYLSEEVTPAAPTSGTLANLYESDKLEVTQSNAGDFYLGITLVEQGEPGYTTTSLFGDFEIVKVTEPVVEANYDDFCKPTAGTSGNKRFQTKGEVLNGNNLLPDSPAEFTPTGNNKNQAWANSENPILANPGATFDLKVTYGDAWGSLTVFQLRSDKTPSNDDKIFGTYQGSWYSNAPGTNELYTNIAKDTESGITASVDEKTVTCPITIPADIAKGELVVIRFIICKTADGATYDGSPCVTDATELNYCDYVVRIAGGEDVKSYNVTVDNTIKNGTVSLTVDGKPINGNVNEGTIVTVIAEPESGYELETLNYSIEGGEQNIDILTDKSFTVTGNTVVSASFKESVIGINNATVPVASTASEPKWFVMKSSHQTAADRQNRFMYWNETNNRLECTQHNEGIKLSEITDVYRWRFEDAGDGNIYIINKATGKALSVPANASSETGNANVNTPLTLEQTGSKWTFGLSSTINGDALPNQYFFDFVDYKEQPTRHAYLNAMDGQATIPYGITIYEMGVQNASGWFIYEAPAQEKTEFNVKVETADSEQGSIAIEGKDETSVTVETGSKITIKATPKSGFMFDKWTKKGTQETVSYRHTFELTVTEDTELVANFVKEGYPLMTRYFITNLSQQNRYLGEVAYTTGDSEMKTLFKCETEEELPFTAYTKLHEKQREGAVIDKTKDKIELVEGSAQFTMLFKQYAQNITFNDGSKDIVCEPELRWTQQAIYIDWNNDLKFEGSEIYDRLNGDNFGNADGWQRNIFIPAGTKEGTYRMRVVYMQFDDNNNISHTNLFTENFGEIRIGMAYDFDIVIKAAVKTYAVSAAQNITGGKITLKVDGEEISGNVEEGKTVTVEVTPDKYYELTALTYKVGNDGQEQDIMESKSFKVTGETVVNATFGKMSYTVTYEQPENGSIKVMNDKTEVMSGDKVEAGTKLTVVDTPNEKYELEELKAGETDITETKTFILEDNTLITAKFALAKYTLTYMINGGEWVADITVKDKNGNIINSGDKLGYGEKYIVRAEKKDKNNAVNIKVNDEQVIANVNGLVYTYEGTVEGDTHITIDLFSDIDSANAEKMYYDNNTQTLYTANAEDVRIYDLSGRIVLNAKGQESISLAQLAEGIYTVVTKSQVLKINR